MGDNVFLDPGKDAEIGKVLGMGIPHYRQAYSDRMAWIMAGLSQLVYLRFEPVTFEDIVARGFKTLLLNRGETLANLIAKLGLKDGKSAPAQEIYKKIEGLEKYSLAQADDFVKDLKKILGEAEAYQKRVGDTIEKLKNISRASEKPKTIADLKKTLEKVEKLSTSDAGLVVKILKKMPGHFFDNQSNMQNLLNELNRAGLEIETSFVEKGTEVLLLKGKEFYALAFRGTEVTSIGDIRTDLKFSQVASVSSKGFIHQGFQEAFQLVHREIQDYLDKPGMEPLPLFITGHSLGGALATIAAKELKYRHGIAACYTYGSPRVGDEEWVKEIKVPVYRVVNSADPVTWLPPKGDFVDFFALFAKMLGPVYGKIFRGVLRKLRNGYMHAGDMRFLTNVAPGRYQDAELLYSVTFLRRIRSYLHKMASMLKIPKDHSIAVYQQKLFYIAEKRNPIAVENRGVGTPAATPGSKKVVGTKKKAVARKPAPVKNIKKTKKKK